MDRNVEIVTGGFGKARAAPKQLSDVDGLIHRTLSGKCFILT